MFAFYHHHYGETGAYKLLTMRIRRGRVERIVFSTDGRCQIDRRVVEVPEAAPFSYEEAPAVRFLPAPDNKWGRTDLALSRTAISARLMGFFDRVADRLGINRAKLAARMHDAGFSDFYQVRRGEYAPPSAFLSDHLLDPIGLNGEEREELRHLEALLQIQQISGRQEVGLGPYAGPGLLIRYWRLLASIPINDIETAFNRDRKDFSLNLTYVEGGWSRLPSREILADLIGRLHPPRIFLESLLDHLLAAYTRVDERQSAFAPKGVVRSFPNPGLDLPYYGKDAAMLGRELGLSACEVRDAAGMTQEEFGRRALGGVPRPVVASVETEGQMSPPIFRAYARYLRRRGEGSALREIQNLRAALELVRNPLNNDGALREAGRRLRYARYLVPGFTVEGLLRAITLPLSTASYLEYEQGYRVMPYATLVKVAESLSDRRAFHWNQIDSFVQQIEAIYRAMGITNL